MAYLTSDLMNYSKSMLRFFLFLIVILIFTPLHSQTESEYQTLVQAFQNIRSQTIWPVEGGSFDDIEETFGPRIQPSTGKYDWHRGIDIDSANGLNIVAVLDSEFDRYVNFPAGGWTVVLKHPFPTPITYNGKKLTHFYTLYMHLDDAKTPQFIKNAQLNQQKPKIAQGDLIGHMGNSGKSPGDDYAVHLHFELRVGTTASLEFQLNNPNTTQWGFDPHIHPMLLYAPAPNTLKVQALPVATDTDFSRINLIASNDDQPIVNRVEITLIDKTTKLPLKQHILDLNRRIGFNASSVSQLDTRDFSNPYFDPEYFLDDQTDYRTQFVIPKSFVENANSSLRVAAFDTWGYRVDLKSAIYLLFQKGNQLMAWEIDQTTLSDQFPLSNRQPGWKLLSSGRFNASTTSDTTDFLAKKGKQFSFFPLRGTTVEPSPFTLPKSRGKIVAVTDIDHNGIADLILQRGPSLYILPNITSDNPTPSSPQFLTRIKGKVKAIDDFNNDGNLDFLYQKGNEIGIISSHNNETQRFFSSPVANAKIIGSTDFNQDGNPDLVVRKGSRIMLWLLQQNQIMTSITLGRQNKAWRIITLY
jgi:murein DD-endopeptidase MepM/ murein hydrolase activator NlpD